MHIFPSSPENLFTIVIGCGRLGSKLANTLSEQGANVVIIDRDDQSFRRLSPSFGGLNIHGDATDFDVLHKADITKADILIAATSNDNANVLIGQMAHELFSVPRVIVRLLDPDRRSILEGTPIDVVCPVLLTQDAIGHILNKPANELVIHDPSL